MKKMKKLLPLFYAIGLVLTIFIVLAVLDDFFRPKVYFCKDGEIVYNLSQCELPSNPQFICNFECCVGQDFNIRRTCIGAGEAGKVCVNNVCVPPRR